jgi:hypothetical protein
MDFLPAVALPQNTKYNVLELEHFRYSLDLGFLIAISNHSHKLPASMAFTMGYLLVELRSSTVETARPPRQPLFVPVLPLLEIRSCRVPTV